MNVRTQSISGFRSLGPLDLVQLTKTTKAKESTTYFFVSGIDVSSSAAVAAYLNTLTFSLGETQTWFGRHPRWKITAGTYCTWNCFSKCDMRVNAKMPGSIEESCIDIRGLAIQATDVMWKEAYMSAMIRALLLVDDDAYVVPISRHVDPFPTEADANQFFDIFEELFPRGPEVGTAPIVQVARLDTNYMVDAFFEVAKVTTMFSKAIEVLQRLSKTYPAALPLLAQALLLNNQEVEAVKLMATSVLHDPRASTMLAEQAKFCLHKKKLDLALDCALRSVAAAPAEFYSWEILTKVYIAREQYDQALLTINSCPLISTPPVDIRRMPPAKKTHCPLPADGSIEEIWEVNVNADDQVDVALLRLPASGLKASSLRAYNLLTDIFAKIGWAQLMKVRGDVFLMETEVLTDSQKTLKDDLETEVNMRDQSQDDSAHEVASDDKSKNHAKSNNTSKDGISLEDEVLKESQDNKEQSKSVEQDELSSYENPSQKVSVVYSSKLSESTNDLKDKTGDPVQASEEAAATTYEEMKPKKVGEHQRSIKSKRLCERRLDSFFMVLYEDVRTYSNWQREMVHFESQQLAYNKSAREWELLGGIAQRLHYDQQAQLAYAKSLSMRFCHRVLWHMLDYLAPQDGPIEQPSEVLDIVIQLMAWNHRWYTEFSPRLKKTLIRLVGIDGITKLKNQAEASFGKTNVMVLVNTELQKLQLFKAPGANM